MFATYRTGFVVKRNKLFTSGSSSGVEFNRTRGFAFFRVVLIFPDFSPRTASLSFVRAILLMRIAFLDGLQVGKNQFQVDGFDVIQGIHFTAYVKRCADTSNTII